MKPELFQPLKEFNQTRLKIIEGQIPKEIKGQMFRNGPGRLNYDNRTVNHFFQADGAIVKLRFEGCECFATAKFVNTPIHKARDQNQSFDQNWFKKIWGLVKAADQKVTANTSVLLPKNSPNFFALVESHPPTVMKKQNLQTIGLDRFGWIQSAFSAHPKVDPENGDIFNIGMKLPNMHVMKMDKNMKKLKESIFKMKNPQSIHDMCLAGNYIVIFQYGIDFSLKTFLTTIDYFKAAQFNPEKAGIAHIYDKQNLNHVKSLEIPPFYSYHFTNGYSTDDKIVVEFSRYDPKTALNLFEMLKYIPQYTQVKQNEPIKNFGGHPILTRMEFLRNKETGQFTAQMHDEAALGQFPLCQDNQVGKQWQTTYLLTNAQQSLFNYNQVTKYNRKTKQSITYKDATAQFNQPAIVRCSDKIYLISIVNRVMDGKSYVEIIEGEKLKRVCLMEVPEFLPPGFHCKWENIQ